MHPFLKHFFLFSLIIFVYSPPLLAVSLTEEGILKLANESETPKLDEIQSQLLDSQVKQAELQDKFGTNLYAGHNYIKTRELGLITFMPVFSPVRQYQMGLKKNFSYGVQGNLYALTDSRSTEDGRYKNLNTTTYALELNLDLWKDLFGKVTKAQVESAKLSEESAKMQADINEKVFKITLRRIYWSLVANQEKLKISNNLYQTAIRQAEDAKRRQANSIADVSEVARYQAQVSSRKGSMLYLQYERENLLKQLRSMLPVLTPAKVELGEYSLNKTVFEVLECTNKINQQNGIPYDYTQFDELSAKLRELEKKQNTVDDSHSDIDVKLATVFKRTGVGSRDIGNNKYEGSYQESLDDMSNNDRSGMSLGLMINIPLGVKGNNTEEIKKQYTKRKMQASIRELDNNLEATHWQISESIKILADVIQTQKENSKQLTLRVNEMQKKFNQARIPVLALIQDQDSLMSTDLSIIDTQLAILNTLLDYFVVFTETPCAFNRN
jgi:hypothetical protein